MSCHAQCRSFARTVVVVLVASGLATAGAAGAQPAGPDDSIDIGEPATSIVWLCRPGLPDDPCRTDLTTTVLRADGTSTEETARPAADPPIDCFYVYPTVSAQVTTNADLSLDPELRAVAEAQASRFSQVCRVYAPIYPQITRAGLGRPSERAAADAVAYAGVVDAWRDYLEHDNGGRGVVLIGHSQGAALLAALIRDEIEGDTALRRRLVAALLPGWNIVVPVGADVGGTFERTPACRSTRQTGCVVSYVSSDETPPATSQFGRVRAASTAPEGSDPATEEVLCVNPSSPAGGTGHLEPYFRTPTGSGGSASWESMPRLYDARCARADGASWLQIDDVGRAGDDRPRVEATLGPARGLHLADVNLALGNLVDLARAQAKAYRRANA